jgi:aryl-alcohol dehydrogenase-like predicted oxidoreductase
VKYTRLGELDVSVIGLGCNTFGRDIGAEQAQALVDEALAAGITFFDTADKYGGGRSEGILGEALGEAKGEVVIGSKFGRPIAGIPDSGGARPEYVLEAVERSLRNLKRDWIDLYQLHRPDPTTPIEDTMGAVKTLVDKGLIREFGCSQTTPEVLGEILRAGEALGIPVVSTQAEYSVINRDPEASGLTQACVEERVGILPYRPLAKGMLTGKLRPGEVPTGQLGDERYTRFITETAFRQVEGIRSFAEGRGHTTAEGAIQWLLHRPAVAAVFPGASRPEQVRANANAGSWELTPEDVAALEAAAG